MKVWFDCTAAAHPIVLRPIIELFRERGAQILVTARENGETVGNLERLGIEHLVIGRHGGAGRVGKGLALATRSARLAGPVWKFRPDLAVAHGSVDLAVLSRTFFIPSAQMQDYEFAGLQRKIAWRVAKRVLVPDAIPVDRLEKAGAREGKLVRFPGLKEDYYLADFEPDASVPEELGIDLERVLVIVRPPPETAAYHAENPLYERVIDRLAKSENLTAVIIPRTEGQAEKARARDSSNLIVPKKAVDAQSLIAFADLVVSAGGTMNREAVALGTPVYTTFAGRMGGVDEALIADGRLKLLESPEQLDLAKRHDPTGPRNPRDPQILVDGMLATLT